MIAYIQQHPIAFIILSLAILGLLIKLIIWYADVNSDRDSFKKFMTDIGDKLDQLYEHLLGHRAIKQGSPLVLTEYGEEISNNVGAKSIVERISSLVLNEVQEFEPYEIQEFCETYMKRRFKPNKEEGLNIKKCQYQMGITREIILYEVVVIELRDKLLELTNQDVDEIED